ncbi:amidase [Kineococcus sp. SYSU DK001]|uniref:amidase n=1 Tax=Kineococcus sp. SYSU DK001 TaxID=3383122 RepID=UPI003D7C776D
MTVLFTDAGTTGGAGDGSSAAARVERALQSIDHTEPDVRAWVRVDADGARAAARALDGRAAERRGPLHGLPFGVKDIVDVAGQPTECGSVLRRGRVAQADAWLVSRLRAAGAVPVGKTVTTEFAYFAPGPTRNPVALDRTPGGSSSGSAAAVAAGNVPLALGSQTAGSLTRPASYCGVTGFVAPVGRVSTAGVVGLSHTLDSVGLLTRRVEDLRPVLEAVGLVEHVVTAPRPAHVQVWFGEGVSEVEADMRAAVDRAAGAVADEGRVAGFTFAEVAERATQLQQVVMGFEAVRLRAEEARHPEHLSEPLNALFEQGRRTSDEEYARAVEARSVLRAGVLATLEDVDAVLGPAAQGVAPVGLGATGSPVLSRAWQFLGLPVVTVAGLRDGRGLPLGVQLIGHPLRVRRLLDVAAWLETRIR